MIDIRVEKVFAIKDARKVIGNSPQVVRRWCRNGRRGRDGEMYFLDSYHNPSGRLCTSVEAIIRFTQALNGMGHE